MRLLILFAAAALLHAGQAPGPTADEVVALRLLNELRADARLADVPIAQALRRGELPSSHRCKTFWAPSAPKQAEPFPPLVWHPALAAAARAMLAAKVKPVDIAYLDWKQPLAQSGYQPDGEGLALAGVDQPSLFHAYAAAMVHIVEERTAPGGNAKPYFAGRFAMEAKWREAGVAVAQNGKTWSVAFVLGLGSAKRHAGGVVYADRNRNGTYEAGEGQAGVTVACGAATMVTGPSGAWWLALPDDAAAEVAFTAKDFGAKRPLAKAAANAGIDWRLPDPADCKAADKLIAEAEKPFKDEDTRRKILAALIAGTRMASLDDARQEKARTLSEPIVEEYTTLLQRATAALSEPPAEFKPKLTEWRGRWKGSLAPLFKELEMLNVLRRQLIEVQALPVAQQAAKAAPLLKPIEKAMADTCDPVLLDQLRTWRGIIEEILAFEQAPVKKK